MRVFIATDVPQWVKEKINEIQHSISSPGVKLVEPENLHITIVFLGEKTIREIEEIRHKLSFLASFEPVKIKIHGVSWFPAGGSPRVVYADVHSKSFVELAETIRYSLGIEEEYTPHLTIARVRTPMKKEWIDSMIKMRSIFIGEVEVSSVKLKKSVLLPTRPVYSDVVEWTLKK